MRLCFARLAQFVRIVGTGLAVFCFVCVPFVPNYALCLSLRVFLTLSGRCGSGKELVFLMRQALVGGLLRFPT